jgi:hypothetical protein
VNYNIAILFRKAENRFFSPYPSSFIDFAVFICAFDRLCARAYNRDAQSAQKPPFLRAPLFFTAMIDPIYNRAELAAQKQPQALAKQSRGDLLLICEFSSAAAPDTSAATPF